MSTPDDIDSIRDVRPVPDPTKLTTAQLLREIQALKELLFMRLDGMDRAVDFFHADIKRVCADTDRQISHLRELIQSSMEEQEKLVAEKFAAVEHEFGIRDRHVEQAAENAKDNLEAALHNAEKAVAKSEISMNKQMDGQADLIKTATEGLNGKIDDLKQRQTVLESEKRGQHSGLSMSGAILMGSITVLLGLLALGSFIFQQRPSTTTPAPQIVYVPTAAQVSPAPAPAPAPAPR
jgi:hypothetical protein